jgi:hypothetical protein
MELSGHSMKGNMNRVDPGTASLRGFFFSLFPSGIQQTARVLLAWVDGDGEQVMPNLLQSYSSCSGIQESSLIMKQTIAS